jgi:exodeoxyribonuclease III
MRIATYNVNGINGRLAVLLRWLKEEQPDVACLQELRSPQERFPEAEITKLGYQAVWHGQKSWNGVAILARNIKPIEIRRGLPGDPEDLHSRYIEARINDIRVGCIYLPNGNPAPGPKFDYKLAWFKRLNAYAKTLLKTGEPIVLCGDYNAVPTDLDAYKPERWVGDAVFFPETKDLYRRLVEQGWTDALRKMHPDEVIYTYWDYFRNAFGRNAGLRMDHLLLSPALASRLVAAGVNRDVRSWEKTSDHAPTWIELKDSKSNGIRRAVAAVKAPAKRTSGPAKRKASHSPKPALSRPALRDGK